MMKTLTFNKNSWHHWIVWHFTNYNVYSPGKADICGYTRALLQGLFLISLASSGVLIAFIFLASPILDIFIHFKALDEIAPIALRVWCLIFLGGVLALFLMLLKFLIKKIYNKIHSKEKKIKEKMPSAIREMYNHWKEKTCVKVEFK